jgi:hypothetical protein
MKVEELLKKAEKKVAKLRAKTKKDNKRKKAAA